MTDKQLRKLNKTELLWIIRDQEAEIAELKDQLGLANNDDSADETREGKSDDES